MNSTSSPFYEESGKAAPLSILLVFVCSFPIILALSYLYSLIITFLPFVYLNFLVVVGLGFAVSFISRIFNHLFKIRNRKKSILITVILSLFAVYFQWVSYIFIVSSDDINVFSNLTYFYNILIRPDLLLLDMVEINKVGLWQFFRMNVNGIALWLIWLVEAATIVFVSYNNYSRFNSIPFSEKDNAWYKKEFIDFDFEHIAYKKEFVENFQNNAADAITELKKGDGLRHSKISIFRSATETKTLFVIDNVRITEKGKGKKDVTNVLQPMYVDNIHLVKIRPNFRFKKASILDY